MSIALKELFNLIHQEPRPSQYNQYLGIGLNRTLCSTTINSRNILPWRNGVVGDRKIPISIANEDEFRVEVDVQQFRPEELRVRVLDGFVIVEGSHEEQTDGHGLISRQFTRRYRLPEPVDQMAITSTLSSDGVLSIQAPLKIMPTEKSVSMAESVPEKQEVTAGREKVTVEKEEAAVEGNENIAAEKEPVNEITPSETIVPVAESVSVNEEGKEVITESEEVTEKEKKVTNEKEQSINETIASDTIVPTAEAISVKEGEKEVINGKEEVTAMEEEETIKEITQSGTGEKEGEEEVINEKAEIIAEKEELTAMEEETVKEVAPSEVSIPVAETVPEKQDVPSEKDVTAEKEVTAGEVEVMDDKEEVVAEKEEETVKDVKKHRRSPSFDPIAEQPPAKRASVSMMVENAPTLISSQ